LSADLYLPRLLSDPYRLERERSTTDKAQVLFSLVCSPI
jgi:hypothetical protein